MTNERVMHSLEQGSLQWHAHRAQYWNASEAPVAMGVSPYKKRSELLHEKSTGIAKEVDDYTQGLFNDGHRFEALARSLAEEIVGTDLYPVSVSLGKQAASLDGLTIGEDIAWEHKSLNDEIRAVTCAVDLPIYYRVQMEQQLHVSGAEKCLFQATQWDIDGRLKEEIHFWYEPDMSLRQQIDDAWEQFAKDLAEYVPVIIPEKPKAEAIMALPSLAVQIRGEVLTSNLPVFKSAAEQFIAAIKMDLKTDEDFVNADATVKFCEAKEKEIAVAMDAAIAQMASVDELMRTGKYVSEQLRTKRLALSTQIEQRKKQIKENAVAERRQKYADHVEALNNALGDASIVVAAPDFAGAIKGLKTIASANDKLDTALANGKISADAAARDLRAKLDWYEPFKAEHAFLFRDLQALIQKPAEDFELAVTSRIAEHKHQEDEKEAKRKADEAEKAKAVPIPAPAAIEPAPITATQAQSAPWIEPTRSVPSSAPTLRLGQISDRLGFVVTASFLSELGFEYAGKERASILYHEDQFPEICHSLVEHIKTVASQRFDRQNLAAKVA